jgi:hypothetical protein
LSVIGWMLTHNPLGTHITLLAGGYLFGTYARDLRRLFR